MKFSVLLPTRNRLEFLHYAIASVLQQDYENWEIIVSDNYSEQDIQGYIKSLNDSRIKYYRTSSFVPVTENWNNAIEKSTGDYVIMLGDDDCLMQGYFRITSNLIKEYHSPDLLYSSALLYCYPKVLQDEPQGYILKWGNASFLEGKKSPYILSKDEALSSVKQAMDFKVVYNFNMQFSLISRELIDRLRTNGSFFQSPYPDYYATTALLLKADRILAVPSPLVVVGISPKSFGFYYFNQKEEEGMEFLKNIPDKQILHNVEKYIMPGTNMNSSWLLSMETAKINFGQEFKLEVNYYKYRFLQMIHFFKGYATKNLRLKDVFIMTTSLFWWEKVFYIIPCYLIALCIRMIGKKTRRNNLANKITSFFSHPSYTTIRLKENFVNILEVFENIKPESVKY